MAHDGPEMVQDAPKMAQDGPKMAEEAAPEGHEDKQYKNSTFLQPWAIWPRSIPFKVLP